MSMEDDEKIISEERAAAIWMRAAELQAESARPAESPITGQLELGTGPVDGYRLADVREAAAAAGIAPEFVSLALIETETDGDVAPSSDRRERIASHLVGTESRARGGAADPCFSGSRAGGDDARAAERAVFAGPR